MNRKNLYAHALTCTALTGVLFFATGCPNVGPGPGNMNGNGNGNDNMNGMNGNDNGNMNDNVNDNDNMNGNGDGMMGGAALNIIKTDIDVRHDAGLQCGDDIIIFGTGGFSGVAWMRPSEGDTMAREVPNADDYRNSGFAVTGNKVCLAGGADDTFQVTVFDADAGTINALPTTDVRLQNIPGGPLAAGNIQASGNYCICRTDDGEVDDGKHIKVIDVSGDTPVAFGFDMDVENSVDQLAIDGTTAVAIDGDMFYVYDVSDPSAAPNIFTLSSGLGFADVQVKLSGDYMLAGISQDTGSRHAALINITDGTITELTDPDSGAVFGLGGDKFVYFANNSADDSLGSAFRTGVGRVPGPDNTKAPLEDFLDGSTTNNGARGFAQTTWVTPDGRYCFIAGATSLGSGEFLQYTMNTSWTVPSDPDGSSDFGTPATDVHASNTCVAFKSGDGTTAGTSTTLGYIILEDGQ